MDNNSSYKDRLVFGLLKSFQCFQDELKTFCEATSQNDIDGLWNQCLIRSQEVDGYAEELSIDTVGLIKTYVMHSRKS